MDIQQIIELERYVNEIKQKFEPPTYEQVEKRKVWCTDEILKKFFNRGELNRDSFKKQVKKERGTMGFIHMKNEIQTLLKEFEECKTNIINHTRDTFQKTLKKYAFLSDVIGTDCPVLFQ